jgi:hypothetical protein
MTESPAKGNRSIVDFRLLVVNRQLAQGTCAQNRKRASTPLRARSLAVSRE